MNEAPRFLGIGDKGCYIDDLRKTVDGFFLVRCLGTVPENVALAWIGYSVPEVGMGNGVLAKNVKSQNDWLDKLWVVVQDDPIMVLYKHDSTYWLYMVL